MKKLGIGVIGPVMAIVITGNAVPAVAASDSTEVSGVAAAVAAAAPNRLAAATLADGPDSTVASVASGAKVSIYNDADSGVAVESAKGEPLLAVSLPGAPYLQSGQPSPDGSITYLGTTDVPTVNVLAADDQLRLSVVIANASQPSRYDYDFGAGVTVEVNPDGGATAYTTTTATNPQDGTSSSVERVVADIRTPWATDAAGAKVATRYEAKGSVLTQVVEHVGASYPVVADPTFDQPNFFQYRVRFDRAETSTIASGGAGMIASIGCGSMLPVCVLAGATIWWNASVANNSGQCVQVTATQPYVVPTLIWWVDQYSGGPCR